jgi:hypothetical protein
MNAIEVIKVVNPAEAITDSAARVADLIGDRLHRRETPVVVLMHGLRGVPSSFFNAILVRLVSQFGVESLDVVNFEFDSELQRGTFTRTLQAMRKTA